MVNNKILNALSNFPDLSEPCVENAVILEVCCHPLEVVVLRGLFALKVADKVALLALERENSADVESIVILGPQYTFRPSQAGTCAMYE